MNIFESSYAVTHPNNDGIYVKFQIEKDVLKFKFLKHRIAKISNQNVNIRVGSPLLNKNMYSKNSNF